MISLSYSKTKRITLKHDMATKDSRNGGKHTGSHTTFTTLAAKVCDTVYSLPGITKILAGYITPGLKPTADRRVKFTDSEGSVLLSVRDVSTMQEIRLYVNNLQDDRTAIARALRNAGIAICFHKKKKVVNLPSSEGNLLKPR